MRYTWRDILLRDPNAAIPGMLEFESELNAVDTALQKTIATQESPISISPFGCGDRAKPHSLEAIPRPIVPIQVNDPSRAAVAVLLRIHLNSISAFFQLDPEPDLAVRYVLLAMADKLMTRELVLSESAAVVLVEVLLRDREYLSKAMKQIERCCGEHSKLD